MLTEILNKVKKVLVDPKGFFESTKKETTYEPAFKYRAVTLVVGSIAGVLIAGIFNAFNNSNMSAIPTLIMAYVIGLVGTFVTAGILHLWIKLFGGTANYTKTFQLYVYSDTPRLLFGWIPLIGNIAAPIYGLYILMVGAMTIHGFSKKKAFLVLVLPEIVLIIIGIIAGVVAAGMFASLYR